MALGADFQVDFRFRRARLETFATGALHNRLNVVRMYVRFHYCLQMTHQLYGIAGLLEGIETLIRGQTTKSPKFDHSFSGI
jgi:hypothetical protein